MYVTAVARLIEKSDPHPSRSRQWIAAPPRIVDARGNRINNMVALLKKQGKHDLAEPLCREALETRRRVLGDDHTNTLNSMNSMARLLEHQGKPAEAEPYFMEALAGRKKGRS